MSWKWKRRLLRSIRRLDHFRPSLGLAVSHDPVVAPIAVSMLFNLLTRFSINRGRDYAFHVSSPSFLEADRHIWRTWEKLPFFVMNGPIDIGVIIEFRLMRTGFAYVGRIHFDRVRSTFPRLTKLSISSWNKGNAAGLSAIELASSERSVVRRWY